MDKEYQNMNDNNENIIRFNQENVEKIINNLNINIFF